MSRPASLSLVQATGDAVWLGRARSVLDSALEHFAAEDGGFYDTADDAEALVARPRDPGDNASPSGLSSMVHALVTAHALTGEGRYRDAAEAALATVSVLAERAPRFAGWSLAAVEDSSNRSCYRARSPISRSLNQPIGVRSRSNQLPRPG